MKDIRWRIGVALCGVMMVSGCVRNQFDQQRYEEIVEEESPTPNVDPDHDWMMSTTKTLVVDPSGIENLKLVRIFTDNPAEEVSAEIVDDAYPSGDNKIVMNISYPIRLQVLYAAAIDNEDYYTIVPFNPNSSGSIDFSNPVVKHQKMSNYFVHQTYVYLFEEEYPQPGDYDFNDVVLSVSMERSDGQEVRFKIQLAAVGGTKQMGAAIRLAGYKYNEVESVKTEDDTSFDITGVGELPDMYRTMIQDKSLLQQSLNGEAVLNLFADAHWATGDRIISESGSITRKRYNVSYEKSDESGKFIPRELTYIVTFKNGVDVSSLTLDVLDAFIIEEYNGNKYMPLLLRSITETNMRCIPINIQKPRCSGRIRVQMPTTSLGLSAFLMKASVGLCMQWQSVTNLLPRVLLMAPIPILAAHLVSGLLIEPNA